MFTMNEKNVCITSKSRLKQDSSKCIWHTRASFGRFSLLSNTNHCFFNASFLGRRKKLTSLGLFVLLVQFIAAQLTIFVLHKMI